MLRKSAKGLLLGAVAGAIDVVPMILQDLSWDANLSAFVHWVVAGFVISTSDLKLNGPVKGLCLSVLLLLPIAIIVGWREPISLVPIGIMTFILGSTLGYAIERWAQ